MKDFHTKVFALADELKDTEMPSIALRHMAEAAMSRLDELSGIRAYEDAKKLTQHAIATEREQAFKLVQNAVSSREAQWQA